jgi:hypothetical protein
MSVEQLLEGIYAVCMKIEDDSLVERLLAVAYELEAEFGIDS